MAKTRKTLGKNVKRMRKHLGYSQAKLAEFSRLSTNFIGEIELGKKFPSPESLERIAKALGSRPDLLIKEVGADKLATHETEIARLINAKEIIETILGEKLNKKK